MNQNFNLNELLSNVFASLKGMNKEQLMTVGFFAYIYGMYKISQPEKSEVVIASSQDQRLPDGGTDNTNDFG